MKIFRIKTTDTLDFYTPALDLELELPYIDAGIPAGFPSPAEDFSELRLDLNKELIKNPSSTFYARVKGWSMKDEGINDGDILVIDKSLEPKDGTLAVCYIDGEFTLKRIKIEKDKLLLMPANKAFKPIVVSSENEFIVWGIVTYVISRK